MFTITDPRLINYTKPYQQSVKNCALDTGNRQLDWPTDPFGDLLQKKAVGIDATIPFPLEALTLEKAGDHLADLLLFIKKYIRPIAQKGIIDTIFPE